MILIDVGNTNIVFAASANNLLKKIKRIKTNEDKKKLKNLINKIIIDFASTNKLDNHNVAIISSVVPNLNLLIKNVLKKHSIKGYVITSKDILPFLRIKYNLKEIGADRLANSIAIIKNKISNSIVIDFGTATTFEVIKNNIFLGGIIFPGINLSKETLVKEASLLKNTEIAKTNKIVANNTQKSIQSGFYWGYLLAINGLIKNISIENKFKPKIILTGGLANIFKNDIKPKPIIKPNLTLEGLQIIGSSHYAKKNNNLQIYKKGLYFLSLGGIGEIGANCYLYCCDDKWIMIDLGLSFADEQFPGVDLLVPKINFIEDIKDNLEAIIISHGHEDHAGAVAYLADKIDCPVYASSFPKLLIENRLKEFGKLDSVNLIELDSNKNLSLENFNLKFIDTTHSIPQPQAIVIETKYGNLLHTADWKIDNKPTLGKGFNKNNFVELGNQGVLALIGDSTNADVPGFSSSEEEVRDELKNVFSRYINRIVVTCFSSNIARIINIVNAAKKNNRKIALIGRSMKKNIEAAVKSNLIEDVDIFISEEEASLIPKENLVIICTGSQGEKRSALYRIAYNSHRNIHLEKDDVVIFSSRDIPGNEKSINALKNLLIRQKVEIITADDDLVHVSGHGHAEEIKQMYNWTKPFISIPVHGEPMHLESHKKISEASQVPITKILQNGKCLKIAPGDCTIVDDIDTGKLIVEGKYLYDSESDFIRDRRKYSYEGIAMLSLVINDDQSIDQNIQLSFIGLPYEEIDLVKHEFKSEFIEKYLKLSHEQKTLDQNVIELIKKSLKFVLKNILQKNQKLKFI